MAVLVTVCFGWSVRLIHREIFLRALKLMIACFGMMFAQILFIICLVKSAEDTDQERIFTAASILLFVEITIYGVIDAANGTPDAKTALFVLAMAAEIISPFISILFWFYQFYALPASRVRKYFTGWIFVLAAVCISITVANIFTGCTFTVDAAGVLTWTDGQGSRLGSAITVTFYLSYLLYILPQRCS